MSAVVLCSAGGAPGVTVTALGLSLAWPGEVVLVDADRDATHAVLAGHLLGRASEGRGLTGVLQAHRERRPLVEALEANTLELPLPAPRARRRGRGPARQPDAVTPRRFVPGFTHLPTVELFDPVWPALMAELRGAAFDVVVDAGRVGHRGLPAGLTGGADLVLLVCRSSLVSLAALTPHLPPLVEATGPGRLGLLVLGPGRPYGAREVAGQFGVPVLGEVPWDPATADELAHGGVGPGWYGSRLRHGLAQVAADLMGRVSADRVPQTVAP